MEQILFWLFKYTIELYVKFLCYLAKKVLSLGGWIFHQCFKSAGRSISSKNLLILGPGESLKPGVIYQELYDYSQTANSKEVINLAHGDGKNGDFWLGK